MAGNFEIKQFTPAIGGEVMGLDLSREPAESEVENIRRALLDRQVLFFRDQNMTVEQLKALGRRFGDLHIHPSARPYTIGEEVHPEILHIHADENTTRTAGDTWHSDVSCDPEPPMASILKLHKIPPSGGDTLFARHCHVNRKHAQFICVCPVLDSCTRCIP